MKQEVAFCDECKREIPEEFIKAFCRGFTWSCVCPKCALKLRNAAHGLPEDTPFQDELARMYYDDFISWEEENPGK